MISLEASKATTGNLEVHPEVCDVSVLLSQAAGNMSSDSLTRSRNYRKTAGGDRKGHGGRQASVESV